MSPPSSNPKVTLTKGIEERLVKQANGADEYAATTARMILSRLEDARQRKAETKGLKPQEAVAIVRSVLGPAVILPTVFTPAFFAMVSRQISLLGLTSDDVERAAHRAKHSLRLPVGLLYVFKTMDRLIAPERGSGDEQGSVTTGRDD